MYRLKFSHIIVIGVSFTSSCSDINLKFESRGPNVEKEIQGAPPSSCSSYYGHDIISDIHNDIISSVYTGSGCLIFGTPSDWATINADLRDDLMEILIDKGYDENDCDDALGEIFTRFGDFVSSESDISDALNELANESVVSNSLATVLDSILDYSMSHDWNEVVTYADNILWGQYAQTWDASDEKQACLFYSVLESSRNSWEELRVSEPGLSDGGWIVVNDAIGGLWGAAWGSLVPVAGTIVGGALFSLNINVEL